MPSENTAVPGRALAATLVLVVAITLSGCSRDGFDDRTATVAVDDGTVAFTLDACGLDGNTLFVVGRSDDGAILQAVIALVEDGETGLPAGTGVSFDALGASFAAFGERSWELRDGAGRQPGQVSSAHLRGARIQVVGEAEAVDEDGRVVTGTEAREVTFELDARCDEHDDQ